MGQQTRLALLVVASLLVACRRGEAPHRAVGSQRVERRNLAPLVTDVSPTPPFILITATADATRLAEATSAAALAATAIQSTAISVARTATAAFRPSPSATPTRAPSPTTRPAAGLVDRRSATSSAASGRRAGGPAIPAPSRTPASVARTTSVRPSPTSRAPSATAQPTADTSALAALRSGGFVIYLRHARTDWSQDPREREWVAELLERRDDSLFEQCDRQRLLSDEGRAEARAIGEAFRRLGIPVGRVLTSPWCRTRETAQLAFGGGEVVGGRLWDTGYLTGDERAEYRNRLRSLLGEPPPLGTNTVLVGHMPQLADATGISLNEGESLLVQPEGGGFRLFDRVSADGWDALAHQPLR